MLSVYIMCFVLHSRSLVASDVCIYYFILQKFSDTCAHLFFNFTNIPFKLHRLIWQILNVSRERKNISEVLTLSTFLSAFILSVLPIVNCFDFIPDFKLIRIQFKLAKLIWRIFTGDTMKRDRIVFTRVVSTIAKK